VRTVGASAAFRGLIVAPPNIQADSTISTTRHRRIFRQLLDALIRHKLPVGQRTGRILPTPHAMQSTDQTLVPNFGDVAAVTVSPSSAILFTISQTIISPLAQTVYDTFNLC